MIEVSQVSKALTASYKSVTPLSKDAIELLLLIVKQEEAVDFEFLWNQRSRRSPKELAQHLDELIAAGLVREIAEGQAELVHRVLPQGSFRET